MMEKYLTSAREASFESGNATITLSRVASFEDASNSSHSPDGQRSLMVHTTDGADVSVHGDNDVQNFIGALDDHLDSVDA